MSPGERPPIVQLAPSLRPRLAFALGCHGIPDRCPKLAGKRIPLCARCLGFLVGNGIAVGAWAVAGLPTASATLVGLACVAPVALDGGLQTATGYRSTNPRRLVTGVLGGFGQITLLIEVARMLLG